MYCNNNIIIIRITTSTKIVIRFKSREPVGREWKKKKKTWACIRFTFVYERMCRLYVLYTRPVRPGLPLSAAKSLVAVF